MVDHCVAVVAATLVVIASAPAEEAGARPKGVTPLFFIVTAVNKDGLVIEPAPMPTKVVTPDKVEYRRVFKGLNATGPTGKRLTTDEVAKRVKPGSVVLVNVDDRPVDPAFLAILKDDAVILADIVPPSRGEAGKPAK